jgi:hypothetical protein
VLVEVVIVEHVTAVNTIAARQFAPADEVRMRTMAAHVNMTYG